MQPFSILERLKTPPAAEIGKTFFPPPQLKLFPHSDSILYDRDTHKLLQLSEEAGTVSVKTLSLKYCAPTFIKAFSMNRPEQNIDTTTYMKL
jgi:hypothetical protein